MVMQLSSHTEPRQEALSKHEIVMLCYLAAVLLHALGLLFQVFKQPFQESKRRLREAG